jgi:1,4-dihydroxy-2-naphthoate octaprenyltransferase
MQTARYIIRVARPFFLLGGVLVYALGVGIADYLGVTIDWGLYLLGQIWVTFMQLSVHFLNEYYDAPADADNPNRTPFSGGSGEVGEDKLPRSTVMMVAFACLAVVASLTVLVFRQTNLLPEIMLIMVLIFLGGFFYSAPPVRLVSSGYGELTTSIIVANLVSAFAFVLQTGELHRLLAMSTFPLTALHFAMMLAFELPDYANDIKYEKKTLMVRIGWQRGMFLHNIFILVAYLLLGMAVTFGMPLSIAGPAFLTLPLGLLQIWQMRRIASGGSPNWTTLTLLPVALFAGMAYLLAFAYWTR